MQQHQIDKNRWDEFITNATNSLPYGYSWHLDIVCKSSWDAIIIGDWQVVLPIPINKKIPFLQRSLPPLFSQQLGFFYKNTPPSLEIIEQVLSSLKQRFSAINIQFNAKNTLPLLPNIQAKNNYILPLHQPYSVISQHFRAGLRYSLKQAHRHQLKASPFQDIRMWETIFTTFQLPKFDIIPPDLLPLAKKLMTTALQKGNGQLWKVTDTADNTLAVAFLLIHQDRIIYLFSATTDIGRKKAAIHFLIDSFLQKYAETPIIFDFEGSSIPGIAEFYASFGASPETYFIYQHLSPLLQLLTDIRHVTVKPRSGDA